MADVKGVEDAAEAACADSKVGWVVERMRGEVADAAICSTHHDAFAAAARRTLSGVSSRTIDVGLDVVADATSGLGR